MKLLIGDEILVTAGKDKGRRGTIEKVFPKAAKVRIPGVNVYKKFKKAVMGQTGGVTEVSRPLPFANVALICPKCGKQTRVGYEITKTGSKSRICKKCGESLPKKGKGKE